MTPTDSPEASWSDARARLAVWSTAAVALVVTGVVVFLALSGVLL